jgi:hypothetical protein
MYNFTLITNYAAGNVPISDFTAWEEVPDVTFTSAVITMIDRNLDNVISAFEYAVYRGMVNNWNRVEDANNRVYFQTAFSDEWTQKEFYFMNLNQDEYVSWDEYV